MARKKKKKSSPRREWAGRYQTRSEPQWRDLGYERMADWLHERDDDTRIAQFRTLLSEVARIRGYVESARTYAKAGEVDRYIQQPDRLAFICAVLQWSGMRNRREREKLLGQLLRGDIPLPTAGKIRWKAKTGDRDPKSAGHAVARMVQQNILTRSLSDAVEKGLDIDDPWVLVRIVKGED